MVWFYATTARPPLPPAKHYEWTNTDNMYVPVVTTLNTAPDAVIELVPRGCKKVSTPLVDALVRDQNLGVPKMCSREAADDLCLNTKPEIEADLSSDEENLAD